MKIIDKLNLHIIDYTHNDDVHYITSSLAKIHKIEIRRYMSVANTGWNLATGMSGNNLLAFRLNQSIALKAIAKSEDHYHLVFDSYIKLNPEIRMSLDVPDRANFVSYLDNRGYDHNIPSYSSIYFIQPHIAKLILAGYSQGRLNMFDVLNKLPREEVCMNDLGIKYNHYRYPNFSLAESDLIDFRIKDKWNI